MRAAHPRGSPRGVAACARSRPSASAPLYKNVRTYYILRDEHPAQPLPCRADRGRDRLVARLADHLPRAAVVRARHHGLSSEDGHRPRSGVGAGRAARDPERSRRRQARCAPHDAAFGSRSCAVDVLDTTPALGGDAQLSGPARDRLCDRLLPGAVLRLAARDPAGARRRGRDDGGAGECGDRGSDDADEPARPGRRRPADRRPSARRACSTSTPRPSCSRS